MRLFTVTILLLSRGSIFIASQQESTLSSSMMWCSVSMPLQPLDLPFSSASYLRYALQTPSCVTVIVLSTCSHLQRKGQRVSYTAWVVLAALWLTMIISLFVSVGGKLAWLDLLYVVSYVKLAVTLLKYIPQVYRSHL